MIGVDLAASKSRVRDGLESLWTTLEADAARRASSYRSLGVALGFPGSTHAPAQEPSFARKASYASLGIGVGSGYSNTFPSKFRSVTCPGFASIT